jgi:hypothetical protein
MLSLSGATGASKHNPIARRVTYSPVTVTVLLFLPFSSTTYNSSLLGALPRSSVVKLHSAPLKGIGSYSMRHVVGAPPHVPVVFQLIDTAFAFLPLMFVIVIVDFCFSFTLSGLAPIEKCAPLSPSPPPSHAAATAGANEAESREMTIHNTSARLQYCLQVIPPTCLPELCVMQRTGYPAVSSRFAGLNVNMVSVNILCEGMN